MMKKNFVKNFGEDPLIKISGSNDAEVMQLIQAISETFGFRVNGMSNSDGELVAYLVRKTEEDAETRNC